MRLIDADKLKQEVYTTTEWNGDVHRIIYETSVDKAPTVNAVVIPEGATNGDMIKAMFNPYKICKYEFNVSIYMTERDFEESDYQMKYDRRWWESPYKAESEE